MSTFRAIWPIVDETLPVGRLISEAEGTLDPLYRRSKVKPVGPGLFSVADSRHVPGSGRTTRLVLIYTCPAAPLPAQWPPGGRIVEHPPTVRDVPHGVDPVVVTALLAGHKVKHTRAERWETIRRWEGADAELERMHGWNVARDRRLMAQEVAA